MPVLLIIFLAIVLLVVLGSVIVGLAFQLLWWALIGLFFGAFGRLLVPGRQPIGMLATAASGIAAGLLGGVVANVANLGRGLQFVIAVLAAAAIVAMVSAAQRAQTHGHGGTDGVSRAPRPRI